MTNGYKYRYQATCRCGWQSRKYINPNDAVTAEYGHECKQGFTARVVEYTINQWGRVTTLIDV
jgi:hypothetical protein